MHWTVIMTTTSLRRPARLAGLVLSLAVSALCLTSPAQASTPPAPVPAAHPAGKKVPLRIQAKPAKAKAHKGERIRIHGHLATVHAGRADLGGTLYLQQEVRTGVWVNLVSGSCSPDSDFDLSLALNVSGTLTLRVFLPETDVYAAAASDVFAIVVL